MLVIAVLMATETRPRFHRSHLLTGPENDLLQQSHTKNRTVLDEFV